jgi:hypothetical protein
VHLDIHLLASAGASGWAAILGLLLAIVAAGDGRWVGAYAGWRVLPGRPRGSLMDIATETIGAGALLTQAVAAAWLYAIGFFPADDPAGALALAALLAGPVAIEPLIVAYRAAAAKLSETRP